MGGDEDLRRVVGEIAGDGGLAGLRRPAEAIAAMDGRRTGIVD